MVRLRPVRLRLAIAGLRPLRMTGATANVIGSVLEEVGNSYLIAAQTRNANALVLLSRATITTEEEEEVAGQLTPVKSTLLRERSLAEVLKSLRSVPETAELCGCPL